jgi:hypothetical protein
MISPTEGNNHFQEIGEIEWEQLVAGLQQKIVRKSLLVYELRNGGKEEFSAKNYFLTLMKLLEFSDSKISVEKTLKSERKVYKKCPWEAFGYEVLYNRDGEIDGFVVDIKVMEGEKELFAPVEIYAETYDTNDDYEMSVFNDLIKGLEEIDSIED